MHGYPSKKLNSAATPASATNDPSAAVTVGVPVAASLPKQPVRHASVPPRPMGSSPAREKTLGMELPFVEVRASKPAAKARFEAEAERQVAEELRQEIAARMSRAGAWQAHQIDAFIGGFPMVSPYHQPTNPSQVASNLAHDQGIKGPHFRRSEPRQSVLASSRDDVRSAVRQASRSNRETKEVEQVVPSSTAPLADKLDVPAQPDASHANRSTALRNESMDPVPKQADVAASSPSLTPLEFPSLANGALGSQASSGAQLSHGVRVEDHGGAGEIFRLDRPTYSQSADFRALSPGFESDELSSEILEYSASGTKVDIDGLGVARPIAVDQSTQPTQQSSGRNGRFTDAVAAAEYEQQNAPYVKESDVSTASLRTKSLENDLRKAKVRIFNPVWEVDRFQWPDICLELLHQRAETMELVARNLIDACQEGLQVLAITSPRSGEGRTTVACCLAKLAGSRGLNVAIVDGDIENPTLSYQTNLDVEQDWKTAILNQLPLEEVAVHSIDDQVTLVPLVAPIDRNEMSTNDNRIELMLQELSESFDLVIVDMGHMESSRSLVTSLGQRGVISAVVAVVDRRSSSRLQVEDCLRRIRQTGVASIGLVENFAA